ncbi:MAG: SspB family protein [Rickettsia endosymbiont of Ixodes persulcatus]|nr:SspB family protein [Rickettsia endosymbiont of Ixodes persulcatus]MCZ6903240.1 SspB family protein [Rickettsia endosymbiont of Ixodes persulcatus]MCZ6909445.1 SspB family protein [Rickettsia endosymbiont of Ixodes persulcatus]MCZ6909944.1 SspB family protein [Rickettsia endosymbiont of Ixodes persulcatus]MCZ6913990.1 SspB family protein [Rickettsia endosymbiont of Ixodes persulcatus]
MNTEYKKFVNEYMLEFVKKILTKIQHENLYWDQLIYISYRTDNPAVILPLKVKQAYPKQITIVLQYQFENLIVNDTGFSLTVSFDGVKEIIYVPFDALISFVDSNNNYSLTFNQSLNVQENHQHEEEISNNKSCKTSLFPNPNVIMLDKFRNSSKSKPN